MTNNPQTVNSLTNIH